MAGSTVQIGRVQLVVLVLAAIFVGGAGWNYWDSRGDDGPGKVDREFADDMVAHHQQAIEMAVAYLRRGSSDSLVHIAREIVVGQAGEIPTLNGYIPPTGEGVDSTTAMAWMGMAVPQQEQPGMATNDELAQLDTERGAELDDLFTRLMIAHHRGGVHMATEAAKRCETATLQALARATAKLQTQEIRDINVWRESAGLRDA